MTKRRIAILVHENENERQTYLIAQLAAWWRKDGHEVLSVTGISTFVPADLLIVHVDLSVVPESYLEFARRYPITLNDRVRDIRKSTFSQNLLKREDSYGGRVIVKSNMNFAGAPERLLKRSTAARTPWTDRLQQRVERLRGLHFDAPRDYRIYDHLQQVPGRYFNHPGFVVEKFEPEMDNDMYCVRLMYFLGQSADCFRLKGPHPIVNGGSFKVLERVAPHPEILAWRERLGIDYGKLDYVEVGGRAILLDVNKTPGARAGGLTDTPEIQAQMRQRADGLYPYFVPHAATG